LSYRWDTSWRAAYSSPLASFIKLNPEDNRVPAIKVKVAMVETKLCICWKALRLPWTNALYLGLFSKMVSSIYQEEDWQASALAAIGLATELYEAPISSLSSG
jgi:hypothetical protein